MCPTAFLPRLAQAEAMKDAGFESFGHFECALENGVRLRNEYDCFFLIADYQLSELAKDLSRATPSGR